MSIKTAEAAKAVRKRLRRIHKLYDTALSYVLSLDADYVLNHIVQNVGEIMELDDCYIMLVDDDGGALHMNARWSSGLRPEADRAVRGLSLFPRSGRADVPAPPSPPRGDEPPWTGVLERLVVQNTAPMIIPDTSTFPHFPRVRGRRAAMPASVVGVPLLFRDKVIGTLTAASWARRDFDPEEVVALTQLATPASLAVENARLYTSLRERLREKEILLEGNQALAGVFDMDSLLAVLAAQMARVVVDGWCGLLLRDGDGLRLHAQASWEAGASLEAASQQDLVRLGGGRGETLRRPLEPDEQPSLTDSATARRALDRGEALPLDLGAEGDDDALRRLALRHGRAAASIVPLVYQNRGLGLALIVLRRNGDAFHDGEYRLLQALANQAAVAITNAQLLDDEKRRAQEKAWLLEAARIAASSLELPAGLGDFAELAARCVGAQQCLIFLAGARPETLDYHACSGLEEGDETAFLEGLTLHLGREPLIRGAVEGRLPRFASDLAITAMGPLERMLAESCQAQALLAYPLVSQGPCLGVVLLLFSYRPILEAPVQDLTDGIVRQAAVFVQNARLFQEVKTRVERMKAIADITEAINAAEDVATIFSIVARNTRTIVPLDWTSLAILDRERGLMRIPVMSFGDDPSSHPQQIYPLQGSLVDQASASRAPVRCDDLATATSDMERHLCAEGLRSMMVVPIVVDREAVATLNLASRRLAAFTGDHVEVLQEMADHLATAIKNASMLEEMKRMNVDLKRMDAIKSDFLSTVAHELRTPLTIIKGYLFVLLKPRNEKVEGFLTEALETIDSQTDHLKELIENLLSLSRIESTQGLLGPNLTEIRLGDVVDEVMSNFRLAARKKGIQLEARLPAADLTLPADRGMLVRLFYNLVGNALKFTEKGSIVVTATPEGGSQPSDPSGTGHLLCSVEDTGFGIAPEHRAHIFERFYHVDSPDRKVPAGTGLGLAIVQSIVEAHGGRIWVDSEPGKGTKFSFTLARAVPAG